MPGLRSQPQGRWRVRSDLRGRIVGAIFTNSRQELGGFGEVQLHNNPLQTAIAGQGVARRLVAAETQYATIAPPPGVVDFSNTTPWAIVLAFVANDVTTTTRLLSYRHAANSSGIQLGYGSTSRLGLYHGSSTGEGAKRSANAPIEAGKPYVVVCGWDDGGYFMYLNGVRQTSTTSTAFVTSNGGTNTDINIGRRNTGSSYLDGAVSLFAHIKGSVDAQALSLNPWRIFEADDEDVFGASAAPVADTSLSGAATLRASASGALSTAVSLSGSALSRGSATGALSTAIPLAGAAALQMAASGVLSGSAVALAGTAIAQMTAAGQLSTAIALSGAASLRATASGDLAGAGAALTGVASARVSAAGALSTAIVLAGGAVGRMSVAGTLGSVQVPGNVADISTISAARIVVFEGSGGRVVPFDGAGSRVTPFGSSGHRVTPFPGSGSRVTPFAGSGSRTVRFE